MNLGHVMTPSSLLVGSAQILLCTLSRLGLRARNVRHTERVRVGQQAYIRLILLRNRSVNDNKSARSHLAMASSRPFQTDALTYGAAPSSSLGQSRSLASSSRPFDVRVDDSNPGARYEADLKKVHEEWNNKIDKEVKGLAKGLRDLVDLADVR